MFIGSSWPLGVKLIYMEDEGAPRVRFFFWLVMHDRCWTVARIRRHGLQDNDACVLYDQQSETINHILLGCVFSREVWARILLQLHLHTVVVPHEGRCMDW